MTTKNASAHPLLSVLLSAALGVAIGACSDTDDTSKDTSPSTGDSGISIADTGTSTADTGTSTSDAGASGGACTSSVYAELGDSCSTCVCMIDPVLASSCQKPCWDFVACSFAAQVGKCAASAAGGAATRPQFEACTMQECGAYLAIPGAEVVSSYSPILRACSLSTDGSKKPCSDDVTKIQSTLKKP